MMGTYRLLTSVLLRDYVVWSLGVHLCSAVKYLTRRMGRKRGHVLVRDDFVEVVNPCRVYGLMLLSIVEELSKLDLTL